MLTIICQRIWNTNTWPKDWKKSVFIPLPKKGGSRDCANNRTISLISHASKVLLKVIQRRLEQHLDREIQIEQAGFRKGRGTRDHISNLRWIMEKAREYGNDIYICFIDYSKAFDCVDHTGLWLVMRRMGIPEHIIVLIKNLYSQQEATVRTEFGNAEWFPIGKGVRQGCILSPGLFNIYSENIMRNANLDLCEQGIIIGGRKVNNLRYADDTTLIARSKEDLHQLIKHVKESSAREGLLLNVKKTKIMTTAPGLNEFTLGTEKVEVVDCFAFLGSTIDRKGGCSNDIRKRLALGRAAMTKLTKIMKDRDVKPPRRLE